MGHGAWGSVARAGNGAPWPAQGMGLRGPRRALAKLRDGAPWPARSSGMGLRGPRRAWGMGH
ncbi:MAG: hypothetical protein EAZ60_27100 [Oscillatoriales cyanobacterium]|nr:MAG: hypothetical protein EAZ83_23455 [Oscillatoriales cyanobacterium]TAE95632.1 MAG: hypothetical protein EAZ79_18110 [Oscillatoriales cyanobacterium]TAF16394.1 MAG: hypothetical protein EAZ73_24770 [Oscillatoriales cyanobacterium]TAF29669.1 MAG: hypothetical protein EAZ69_24520 [Oscillatoriales cyanobacterium]TAF51053.1 MAG: hypothetical protein EAZ60_27100 [Oscillatoriales cyanobacterium]